MNPTEQAKQLTASAAQVEPKRGLEEVLERAAKEGRPLNVKLGLDPTAPDIHLGHSVVLRKLRQFQDLGHTVVLIVGDFTTLIGDPSGRSKTRPQLTEEEIKVNATTYKKQAVKILDSDPKKLSIRFNSEWLGKLKGADFVRLFTKVTASQILAREDFQKRVTNNAPIGLHELLYPVLQGFDSVAVKADVELGGTDQTFNLLMGREVQQQFGLPPQAVLTMPLLVGLDGTQKMSKSLKNYVGITEDAPSIFGKIMSLPDVLMESYAALLTTLAWRDLKTMPPMEAKKKLAETIAAMYTSPADAEKAQAAFASTFQKGDFPKDAPEIMIAKSATIAFILTDGNRIFRSNSEARRKIGEGAVTINGKKIDSAQYVVALKKGESVQLKVGKRQFYRLTGQ